MTSWISITEARKVGGLRLVLLRNRPSPWGMAARNIFEVKGIPFQKVERAKSDPPSALLDWTKQNSFPAAMYEDERPRTGWEEILWLAERLSESLPLIPENPRDRMTMFALSRELMGEMGLIWCFRLYAMPERLDPSADHMNPAAEDFANKYHSGGTSAAWARTRAVQILTLLDEQMQSQEACGQEYLVGSQLTAADIYLAKAFNLLAPLPPAQLPISDDVRVLFTASDPGIVGALTPRLLALRDRIYAAHLRLPMEL